HFGLQNSGRGIIKNYAQFALILATELAHFERSGSGAGLPIDVPGRIVGHVFSDAIKIVAATSHKRFEFTRHHWKQFKKLVGGFNNGKNDDLASQVNSPGLHQERKWEARRQSEVFIRITPAGGETYLTLGAAVYAWGKCRIIHDVP